jgi:hypothetical protein
MVLVSLQVGGFLLAMEPKLARYGVAIWLSCRQHRRGAAQTTGVIAEAKASFSNFELWLEERFEHDD